MIDERNFLSRLEEFQMKHNIRISDQAQKLIYQVIDAIENDPHASWNTQVTNLKNATTYFEGNIETLFGRNLTLNRPWNLVGTQR